MAKVFFSFSTGSYLQSSARSIVEGDRFNLSCAVSKFRYSNLTWRHDNNDLLEVDEDVDIKFWETDYSIWSHVQIKTGNSSKHHGQFSCQPKRSISSQSLFFLPFLVKTL